MEREVENYNPRLCFTGTAGRGELTTDGGRVPTSCNRRLGDFKIEMGRIKDTGHEWDYTGSKDGVGPEGGGEDGKGGTRKREPMGPREDRGVTHVEGYVKWRLHPPQGSTGE